MINYMQLASNYLKDSIKGEFPFCAASYEYLCYMAAKQARANSLLKIV